MDQLWRQVGDMFGDLYRQATAAIGQESLDSISSPPSLPAQAPLSLRAPQEDEVVPRLVDAGAQIIHAMEMWTIHRDRALELANKFQSLFDDACSDIDYRGRTSSSIHLAKLASKLQASYDRTLLKWLDEMTSRVPSRTPNKNNARSHGRSKGGRTPFNQDFRPCLEAFFEKKQFPSHAEKALLARKSSMTFSQVNIWFQNHRARAKKNYAEEQRLNKGNEITGATFFAEKEPIDLDGDTDTELDALSSDRKSTSLSRCSSITLCDDDVPFHCQRRSYAFPTIYPPEEKDYPFPNDPNGFVFAKPTWTRYPSASKPARTYTATNMDEITDAFEHLRIQDETPDLSNLDSISEANHRCNVMDPITIHLPPAPLPSLICRLASSLQPYTRRLKRRGLLKRNAPSDVAAKKGIPASSVTAQQPGSTCIRMRSACHTANPLSTLMKEETRASNDSSQGTVATSSKFQTQNSLGSRSTQDTSHLDSVPSSQVIGGDIPSGVIDFTLPGLTQIASTPEAYGSTDFDATFGISDSIPPLYSDLFPPFNIPIDDNFLGLSDFNLCY